MKKYFALLLALCLILAGCGSAAPEATQPTTAETTEATEASQPETTEATQPETTEATQPEPTEPPAPETRDYTVQTDKTPAVLAILSRGQTAQVVGQLEGYHVIRTEQGYGLVELGMLRPEGEAAYEPWTGYANFGAEFMDNYHLTGEPLKTLGLNTSFQVLEELPHCYLIQLGEELGFLAKEKVSKNYIQYSGGGGGEDGGDITMGFMGRIDQLSFTAPQEGEVTGNATALCDGTMVLLGWFDRGEAAQVITQEGYAPAWEGYTAVYLKGLTAYVPQSHLWDTETEGYAQWTGYSTYNTPVFKDHLLLGDPAKILSVNTNVTVLWDTGKCLVISVGEEIFYVDASMISRSVFSTSGGGGGDWTDEKL